MLERLKAMKKRLEDIDRILTAGEGDFKTLAQLSKERASLETPVAMFDRIVAMEGQLAEAREMMKDSDPDMREMAKEEANNLEKEIEETRARLQVELLPKDENDDKNVIMEIRGAAGGDEANIFAGDLFRMYEHYADKKGWKIKVLDSQPTALGGYSLVSFMVVGKGAYSRLKFESGAHRVQRVPVTEANGRIQTSHLPFLGRRRTEREQDGVGRPHHAQADGDRRRLPSGEEPDAEQGDGHGDAQGQAPEQIRIRTGREDRLGKKAQGRHGGT